MWYWPVSVTIRCPLVEEIEAELVGVLVGAVVVVGEHGEECPRLLDHGDTAPHQGEHSPVVGGTSPERPGGA